MQERLSNPLPISVSHYFQHTSRSAQKTIFTFLSELSEMVRMTAKVEQKAIFDTALAHSDILLQHHAVVAAPTFPSSEAAGAVQCSF